MFEWGVDISYQSKHVIRDTYLLMLTKQRYCWCKWVRAWTLNIKLWVFGCLVFEEEARRPRSRSFKTYISSNELFNHLHRSIKHASCQLIYSIDFHVKFLLFATRHFTAKWATSCPRWTNYLCVKWIPIDDIPVVCLSHLRFLLILGKSIKLAFGTCTCSNTYRSYKPLIYCMFL